MDQLTGLEETYAQLPGLPIASQGCEAANRDEQAQTHLGGPGPRSADYVACEDTRHSRPAHFR